MMNTLVRCAVMMLVLVFSTPAFGQWMTQTITLRPGWNAVFLEVQPEPDDCYSIFHSMPVESVWARNPGAFSVEYIKNPDELVPALEGWMAYFPPYRQERLLTNLFAVRGGKAYLINLAGQEEVEWNVSGQPCIPKIDWKPDSFNLVGFHLPPGEEPFFGDFFSSAPAQADQEIYYLDQNEWKKVQHPLTTRMKHGEAYWVYCKGHSDYVGPLAVTLEQGRHLDYGRTLVEQGITVKNESEVNTTVAVNVTGDVPLLYWRFEPEINEAGWTELPAMLTLAAGEKKAVRLAVKRSGLTRNRRSKLASDGEHESLLEITNGSGMRLVVPVTAKGTDMVGLWVGSAVIKKVSHPLDNNILKKTISEFTFRLIVHVNDAEKVRLLKEIIQVREPGTFMECSDEPQSPCPCAGDPERKCVDQPGKFVFLSNDSKLQLYEEAGLRDGQPIGRRISSAAFGFSSPVDMTGVFSDSSILSCTLILEPDDPTNPFFHRYHPDHGNPGRSYRITREIELKFGSVDADGKPITGIPTVTWGGTDIGGIYKETIKGLHKQNIDLEGIFLLHKISSVGQLES